MWQLILAVLDFIKIKTLWKYIKTIILWLKPSGISRNNKPLHFKIGESAYTASTPYINEREVSSIIGQVIIGNSNKVEKFIISFRLEYENKAPYLVAEARQGKNGHYLVPSGGGFSSVPSKTYLNIPTEIPANGGIVGWIGFTMIERRDLRLSEVWKKQAKLIAVLSDGKEIFTTFPKCFIPRS
jgi:hypothetical protein